MDMTRIGIIAAAIAGSGSALHAGVVADSLADFTFAANDGIGADGAAVTPGSAADAAQQGHSDSSGSGTWLYGYGRSGDGQAFGGGFPLLDFWDGDSWGTPGGGPAIVSAGGQAPAGSTINANPMTYRRWTSNGANAGDLLTVEVRVTLTSPLSDGVTLVLNSSAAAAQEALITPSMVGQEQVFTLDFTDADNTWVLVGLNPLGINGPSVSDFFNDGVRIQVTIVPGIGSGLVLLGGLVAGMRRRR